MKSSLIIDSCCHTVLSGSFFQEKTLVEALPQVINIHSETRGYFSDVMVHSTIC